MRASPFIVLPFVGAASAAFAQTPADGWSGQMQCVIVADAPSAGYRDEQTQTWVVTGPPTPRADFRDYPVTWTVTGSGHRTPPPGASAAATADTWTRTGTANGTITLFVPVGTKTLRIAAGQKPLKAVGGLSGATTGLANARAAVAAVPFGADVDEWRFQYVDVADALAQTSLNGARTNTRSDLVAWRQPAGAAVTETCTWNLAKGNSLSTATSQSAATAVAGTAPKLGAAGSTAGGIQQVAPPAAPAQTGSKNDKPQGREGDVVDLHSTLRLEWTQPVAASNPTPTLVSGGSAALSLVVGNAGPGAADGAKVSFPPVPGITLQSVTCTQPKCPNAAELQQGWNVPQLAASGSVRFTIKIGVTAPSGMLALTARAAPAGKMSETNTGDDTATLNAHVVPAAADLQVSIAQLAKNPSIATTRFDYEVTVKNVAPIDVRDAVVTIPSIGGLRKLAVAASCPPAGNGTIQRTVATCPTNPTPAQVEQGIAIPELQAGSSVKLTVDALATTSGTAMLSASAAPPPGIAESAPANNSATATVLTAASAPAGDTDVVVEVVSPYAGGPRAANVSLSYDVKVRNAGQAAADGAIVTVPAVAGIRKLSVSCAADAASTAQRFSANFEAPVCPAFPTIAQLEQGVVIPRLPPGTAETFSVDGIATVSGNIVAPASVSLAAGFTDPVAANNNSSATLSVGSAAAPAGNADIQVTIAEMHKGPSTFGFEVRVANAGPDAANFTVIRASTLAGLTATQVSCADGSAGRSYVPSAQCPPVTTLAGLASGLEIPRLPSGSSLIFELDLRSATPPTTATLTATATAPTGGTDPNPGNNSTSVTATLQ
jgi:hypothetical protein